MKKVVIVENPFTIEFETKHSNTAGSNTMTLRVFNLAQASRESIRKDYITYGDKRPYVKLYAGYEDANALIFSGTVRDCTTTKSGVDSITTINAFDNGEAFRAQSDRTYKSGTPKNLIISELLEDLKPYGILSSVKPNFSGSLKRGNSISGKTLDLLNQLTENAFFINNMKAYILRDDEALSGQVRKFSADSGLIGSPRRQQAFIYFDTVFEPRIQMGQFIEIESKFNPHFNGQVKIIEISHKGTISDSVASSVISTFGANFQVSDKILKQVIG